MGPSAFSRRRISLSDYPPDLSPRHRAPRTPEGWRRFIYDEFDRPVISPHISLAEGLERYPMECLNAMLKALRTKIPKDPQAKKASIVQRLTHPETLRAVLAPLGAKERSLLSELLSADGCLPYQTLADQFGDETGDSFSWYTTAPVSTIGRTRLRGLIFVGKRAVGRSDEKLVVIPNDLRALLRSSLDVLASSVDNSPSTEDADLVYELEVSFTGITPKIWRRFTVPARITLAQLHEAIETSFGWACGSFYEFVIGGERYGDASLGAAIHSDQTVRLQQVANRGARTFQHLYRTGGDWTHRVTLRKVRSRVLDEKVPSLLGGARNGPPIDINNEGEYDECLRILADPTDPFYQATIEDIGPSWDPEAFDQKALEQALVEVAEDDKWVISPT